MEVWSDCEKAEICQMKWIRFEKKLILHDSWNLARVLVNFLMEASLEGILGCFWVACEVSKLLD